MRKTNEMNLVTVTVNGVAITCTEAQAVAIVSACAPTSVASSTPAKKQTAKTSKKSSNTTKTSTKTSKKSSKKQTAPKSKQPKVVELANVTRNGKTVGFDKPINKVVFKFHTELAKDAEYATVNGCPTWTFKSEAKAKAFEKKAHAQLTESEFEHACNTRTERTDADKQAYKDAYDKEWAKYVDKCKKDGIKRTSEMNKTESARIRKALARA